MMRRHNRFQATLLRWQQELAAEGARLSGGRPARAGPYYILELTPRCTQDCRYCYNVWKLKPDLVTGELDTQGWCELIAKVQDEADRQLVTFSGGEPLLRDDFRDILAFCHRRGLESSWERALAAMTRLYQADAPWCGVFVATCENVGQVRQTLEMIVALGATAVMFNRFNPGGEGARHLHLMPSVDQVRDALAVVDELAATYDLFATASIPIMPCLIDTSPYRHVGFGFCAAGRDNAYYTVGPDGRVRPCNHSATVLGDLRTQPLAEILAGPGLSAFTAAAPDVCRPCPGLSACRAGCRAAAEVCFGSLSEPEPWLRANLERLPPDPPTRHSSFDV